MNQQINLFLEEFRITKDRLTAVLMGQLLGGLLLVLALFSAYDLFSRWQLNNELTELRSTLAAETSRTGDLDEQLARRSQNTELTARLDRAEARLASSRQIRDFLSQTTLGNVDGFSEYFKDLSRAAKDGISISEFAFSNGGESVRIVGQVVDSATVPRFVDNIEQGASPLRNMHFSPAISRGSDGGQLFSFVLDTDHE